MKKLTIILVFILLPPVFSSLLPKVQAADTTLPTVTSLSINPSQLTQGSSFTISYSVSDSGGSGLLRVELWRSTDPNPNSPLWSELKVNAASGNSNSGSFTDAPTSGGDFWYGIHVLDVATNMGKESSLVKGTVNVPDRASIESIQRPNAVYNKGEFAQVQVIIRNTGTTGQSYLVEFSIIGPPATLVPPYEMSSIVSSFGASANSVSSTTSSVSQFIEAGQTGMALLKWKVPDDALAGSYSLTAKIYSYNVILNTKGSLLDTRNELFLFSVDQGYSYIESCTFAFGATGIHMHISNVDLDSPAGYGISTRQFLWYSRFLEIAELVAGHYVPDLPWKWVKTLGQALEANDKLMNIQDVGSAILFNDNGADFLMLQFIGDSAFLFGHDFVWLKNTSHWPDPGILTGFNFNSVKVPGYWMLNLPHAGTVMQLSEPSGQHKLYLHIYDNSGHHVGLNYANNQVETQIPGAYYTDLGNRIVIFLPLGVSGFRYTVDAKLAEKPFESYTISMTRLNGTTVINTLEKNDTITKGQNKECVLYYLSVSSPYGTPNGEGWYENGSSASFSVSPTEISIGFLTSKTFVGWSGDAQTKDANGSVTIDSSKSVVAVWSENYTRVYVLILAIILIASVTVILIAVRRMRKR